MLRMINQEIPLVYNLTDKETTLLEGIMAGFVNVRTDKTSKIFYKDQPYDGEYDALKNKLPEGAIEISGTGIRFDPKIISSGVPELTFELYTNGLYDHNQVDRTQKKIIGHNVYNGWNKFVGCLETHIGVGKGIWLYVGCKVNQKNLIRTMYRSTCEIEKVDFDLDEFIRNVKDDVYEFHSALTPIWEKINNDLHPRKFGQTSDKINNDWNQIGQVNVDPLKIAYPYQIMQGMSDPNYINLYTQNSGHINLGIINKTIGCPHAFGTVEL